jgi:serine/threonine protein kinase
VRSVLARREATDWKVRPGDTWCQVDPPGARSRVQGWKLHVSATSLSAPLVLARSADVLIRYNCPFKFAVTVQRLQELVSRLVDRGGGGKFITAYFEGDDDRLRALAEELHLATDGLPGPGILSDRPYRPGSLVHYRFGVFSGVPALGNDGSYEAMLTAPDGSLVVDKRNAWFSPPSWAPRDPFTDEPARSPGGSRPTAPKPVLLDGRYVVREVIRHAYTGGVYRAMDQHTDTTVIIKQARSHTGSNLTGQDVRHLRRHEAEMLRQFESSGMTPRLVGLFEQQGDLFLVQEEIPGVTLHQWASKNATPGDTWGPAPTEAERIAHGLVDLMDRVHARGFVLRDFNPSNVMITDDGDLRLIDLELLAPTGEPAIRAFTPGYAAPEQTDASAVVVAHDPEADLYSLGATLFHLVSGVVPSLVADEPKVRTNQERIRAWLERLSDDNAAARRFAPIIVALLHADPARRPSLAAVRDLLTEAGQRAPDPATAGSGRAETERLGSETERLDDADLKQMISDAVDHLVVTMERDHPERLWPLAELAETSDPANVQYGAAGVLAVLVRAYQAEPAPFPRDATAAVAGWIKRRADREPRALPGLYFGRSGTAWALLEAGAALGDESLIRDAIDLARRVPIRWPNPDVCHGVAGAGLTQLRFWEATGDQAFLDRTRQAAEALTAAAERKDGLVRWPIPRDFESALAGVVHYGFAHGVAGVGAFLLAASRAIGANGYLDLAVSAGETLVSVAQLDRGAASWPRNEDGGVGMTHWCSGSSGVGTFLVRLWQQTGDSRYCDLVTQAAVAVRRTRWHAGTAQCHGLAGDGEFLLDLADASGEERFRDWAGELAVSMYARHALRDERVVVPNDMGTAIVADFNTGLSGVLAFLLRLRYGGPRLWLPESLTRFGESGESNALAMKGGDSTWSWT